MSQVQRNKAIKLFYQACGCYLHKIEQFRNQKSILIDHQTEQFDIVDKTRTCSAGINCLQFTTQDV